MFLLLIDLQRNIERSRHMDSQTLKEIGYALGMGRHVARQTKAFEYVINTAEKSTDELATTITQGDQSLPMIFDRADKDLPEVLNSAAERIASRIETIHNQKKTSSLPEKWENLFNKGEFSTIKQLPEWIRKKDCTVYFDNYSHPEKERAKFAIKVIRNSVAHYLEDIKYLENRKELNSEEQFILEHLKNSQEVKPLTLNPVLDEQTVYNLWKIGILQCEIDR